VERQNKFWIWAASAVGVVIVIGLIFWFVGSKIRESRQGSPSSNFDVQTTPDLKNVALKFDKPAATTNPLPDPNGPFFHKVYLATSNDGINFERTGQLIMDKSSVPDIVEAYGVLFIYAVDGAERSNSGFMIARSFDEGKTWEQGSLQMKSGESFTGAVDPQVVLTSEGKIRLFYLKLVAQTAMNPQGQIIDKEKLASIRSAISEDGVSFTPENGARFETTDFVTTDPDVIRIGNRWFMYLSKGPELVAATSADGDNFSLLQSIRANGSVSKTVSVAENQYRQFYCSKDGIKSAISADGLGWQEEAGFRLAAQGEIICDPSPIKIDDKWLLIYKLATGQNNPVPPSPK